MVHKCRQKHLIQGGHADIPLPKYKAWIVPLPMTCLVSSTTTNLCLFLGSRLKCELTDVK